MLIELRIQNYAVIDMLSVELSPGLNALTGETGAGKSIIVGALSLLLGERASSDVVRAGAPRAVVEGVFDVSLEAPLLARLDELGIEADDGLLILKREVAAEGRNRAWVNGSPATARVVGELGRSLVDLHGQHEHQTLLKSGEQRAILDAFGGSSQLASRVRELHFRLDRLLAEREERSARTRELETRADFLRFQLQEIEAARLTAEEDQALGEEARQLEHAEERMRSAEAAASILYTADNSVSETLAVARRMLAQLVEIDPALEPTAAELEDAFHAVAEVGRQLADYAGSVEHDPARLEEIRGRQDLLFRLKRKYGPNLAEVIDTGRRLQAELSEIESSSFDAEQMNKRVRDAAAALEEEASKLTAARAEAVTRLGTAVGRLLPELGMHAAVFEVALEPQTEIGSGGAEAVAFRASLNPGFEPRPLARIASGGELSRVMLALKSILATVDRVPTLVFDEIDVGIGGVVAGKVASKLRAVAGHHQVFVVTHLPQIAARAHHHLLVEKTERAGMSSATVTELEGEGRVRELARLLGGDPDSAASLEHARELLYAN